jgi:hypothetical protein
MAAIRETIRNSGSFISRHINRRKVQEIIEIALLEGAIFYSEETVSCEES